MQKHFVSPIFTKSYVISTRVNFGDVFWIFVSINSKHWFFSSSKFCIEYSQTSLKIWSNSHLLSYDSLMPEEIKFVEYYALGFTLSKWYHIYYRNLTRATCFDIRVDFGLVERKKIYQMITSNVWVNFHDIPDFFKYKRHRAAGQKKT